MFHVKHSEVLIMRKRKKTAYERERSRIMRLERKLKKQGVSFEPTNIPTLKKIKERGFKGKDLRAYVNKLKKITEKTLKESTYLPDVGQIAYDNFQDEFLNKFGMLTPEEEELFSDEADEEDYSDIYQIYMAKLSKPIEEMRGVKRRRPSATQASRNNQNFLVNLIKETASEIGESALGYRLIDKGGERLSELIQYVLYGSSEATINTVSDELVEIITGRPVTFSDKMKMNVLNDVNVGW